MCTVQQPALYITGENDPVGTFAPMDPMKGSVPNLKIVTVPECGHWTPQEKPAELNAILVDWLRRRFGLRA